ncbi:MAG: hypothetical protein Q4D06_06895 [Coriobacteriia bacterium]|nr:hypothetical protein [Coriobacteriia bacterium]
MRKRFLMGVTLASTVALSATLGAGMAFGAAVTDISDINGGNGASWTVPTSPMTNTVWKDADGNIVDANTPGAKQYKVLTTWAEAWSTAGPDFLGVSNSAYYGNGGNGNAKVTNYTQAQKSSMVGIWATSANESPNAYNWNTFYNFYAEAMNKTASDWSCVSTTSNGGSDWDSASGVWCGFKYRPDVVWTNNNLNAAAAADYVKQINEGKYSASATKATDGNKTYVADANEDGSYDSSYAQYGDATYNPQVISPNNNSPYSFVASAYQLADASAKVIADTANNPGIGDEALTWKNANKLPRSGRYSETPTECALNVEKLARGSVYYTLSKIADGTVNKKKVAYVAYPFGYSVTNRDGSVTTYTDDTQVIVAEYDYTENIGSGPMDGRASWSPLTVDQLSTKNVYAPRAAGTAVSGTDNSTTTFTLYYATADDLADCDVVYSPHRTVTSKEWKEWIEKNATPSKAANASKISYVAASPAITNGSNYTMEKLIYGAYAMDTIYPELFKNMEMSSYWFNKIYHIKASNLAETMSWGYAKSSLPAGTSLATIGNGYDVNKTLNKFEQGYKYFQASKDKDATIARVLANKALDGSVADSAGNPYAFNGFTPTSTWVDEDHSKYVDPDPEAAAQTISVTKSTWSKTYGNGSFSLGAKAKTALTYKSSNTKVATVSSKGTVTIKGAGTAKITISAAATKDYKAATKTVTIKVAKKAQSLTVSTAKKTAAKGKYTTAVAVKGAKGTKSFKKVSGSKYLTVTSTGKIKVSAKAKKGATYSVKVKVSAKETANYKAGSKTVTIKVKVK